MNVVLLGRPVAGIGDIWRRKGLLGGKVVQGLQDKGRAVGFGYMVDPKQVLATSLKRLCGAFLKRPMITISIAPSLPKSQISGLR